MGTDGKDFNTSIYFILESACLELARISYQRLADAQKIEGHQGGQKPFCQNFVYSRMLWSKFTTKHTKNEILSCKTLGAFANKPEHAETVLLNSSVVCYTCICTLATATDLE